MPTTTTSSTNWGAVGAADTGLYGQREVGVNLDLSRALSDRVHVAGGVEWRNEQFRIGLGQPESW